MDQHRYSFSKTFKLTPPKKPNTPPIIPVNTSIAPSLYPNQAANMENIVAQIMATRI